MSDSTYSAEFDKFDPEFCNVNQYRKISTQRYAIYKCVIKDTWNEGDPVPGFEIPKGCIYAKGSLKDAKIHPISGDMICVFNIALLFSDNKDDEFEGWR